MEKFLLAVFGASWRTTLIGYVGAALVELALALQGLPGNPLVWHTVAIFVAALGRAVKDGAVTGGTVPATKEAEARLERPPTSGSTGAAAAILWLVLSLPSIGLAQEADPTAANSDPGTAIADATAQAAPDPEFRLGMVLPLPGRPVLIPAVAITPFAMSLRDGSVTAGLTVGAGYELLWRATTPTARGLAVYANMRSTADGPRPLVSLLGIFTPYLGAGVGYQVGGAGSFRDAAVVLVSVGTNFGVAPK